MLSILVKGMFNIDTLDPTDFCSGYNAKDMFQALDFKLERCKTPVSVVVWSCQSESFGES
jgi:hypothetical protein